MSNIIYNGERLLQMVRYSDELLDEMKSKNDIVDIVSQYVVLKRTGRNYMGLCPFHKEKSGSFCVSPDKQIFHCFGCGVGGNVFHFISKIENLNFKESVEMSWIVPGLNYRYLAISKMTNLQSWNREYMK